MHSLQVASWAWSLKIRAQFTTHLFLHSLSRMLPLLERSRGKLPPLAILCSWELWRVLQAERKRLHFWVTATIKQRLNKLFFRFAGFPLNSSCVISKHHVAFPCEGSGAEKHFALVWFWPGISCCFSSQAESACFLSGQGEFRFLRELWAHRTLQHKSEMLSEGTLFLGYFYWLFFPVNFYLISNP